MNKTGSHQKPLQVFYSYSHLDENLRDQLKKHLSPLKHSRVIVDWYDRDINAGKDWKKEIDDHLNTADIILLLVSANFTDSDYCYGIEMERALERAANGEAHVIPILLKPVYWIDAPFGGLEVLPKDAKPITDWRNRDSGFKNVAEGIKQVCDEIQNIRSLSPKASIASVGVTSSTEDNTNLPVPESEPPLKSALENVAGQISKISLKPRMIYNLPDYPQSSRINILKFTPDGKYLVGGLNQDRVAIWDISTGRLKNIDIPAQSATQLGAMDWPTRSITISPNGKLIATTTYTQQVQLWNFSGLKPLDPIKTFNHIPTSVAFSPDGKWLIAGLDKDGWIQSWSVTDNFRSVDHVEAHHDRVTVIKFHPKKLSFASASVDGKIRYWEIVDEEIREIRSYEGHDREHIVDLAFSPDGELLASGSVSGQIYLWDVETGEPILREWKHEQVVRALAFSPDGKFLASGANDRTLKIWKVADGSKLISKKFDHAVATVDFSPDGQYLVVAAEATNTAQIWSVEAENR